MKSSSVSECCNAKLKTWTSKDGTSFWVCTKCDRSTDAVSQTSSDTDDNNKPPETIVDIPCCERCGATLLLFDEHKCSELEYPAYHLREATKKIETNEAIKLNTLGSSFAHEDIISDSDKSDCTQCGMPAYDHLSGCGVLSRMEAKIDEVKEKYKKLDSGKKWESILKLGIVDENEGTITFSYNELLKKLKEEL